MCTRRGSSACAGCTSIHEDLLADLLELDDPLGAVDDDVVQVIVEVVHDRFKRHPLAVFVRPDSSIQEGFTAVFAVAAPGLPERLIQFVFRHEVFPFEAVNAAGEAAVGAADVELFALGISLDRAHHHFDIGFAGAVEHHGGVIFGIARHVLVAVAAMHPGEDLRIALRRRAPPPGRPGAGRC